MNPISLYKDSEQVLEIAAKYPSRTSQFLTPEGEFKHGAEATLLDVGKPITLFTLIEESDFHFREGAVKIYSEAFYSSPLEDPDSPNYLGNHSSFIVDERFLGCKMSEEIHDDFSTFLVKAILGHFLLKAFL